MNRMEHFQWIGNRKSCYPNSSRGEIASFSHRQWDHQPWEKYTPEQSKLIDQMMSIVPSGSVLLPDTPFEIRWGELATSHMLTEK